MSTAHDRPATDAPRIEDVARRAGVSPITVSRVVNRPDSVSPNTRARVLAAIEQLGYVPNLLAGGLASRRLRTVGVLLPYIANPAFNERVQGTSEVLAARGYSVLLGLTGYDPGIELQQVTAFLGQRVSGLVLTGTVHAERTRALLANAGVPVVEVPLISGTLMDMGVGYHNDAACHAMVEHLARCGYRKVALLSTPAHNDNIVGQRRDGYRRAVRDLGLVDDATLIAEAPVGITGGSRAFVDLIGRHPSLDAIFCTTDLHAVGCMLEAQRRGMAVPGDIGIAGHDDIEIAREFVPSLTTVRVPTYEVGRVAARLLLQRIDGQPAAPTRIDLGFEIVQRHSTRQPYPADEHGPHPGP